MDFYNLVLKNLINLPLLCFLGGIGIAFFKYNPSLPSKLKKILTICILFSMGLKGGGPLLEHASSQSSFFLTLIATLILWALIQPFLSFYILKAFTRIDKTTAAAIAACFGSISVITFVTTISFLDQLQISYQSFIIASVAIMDIPAIISGIFLAKKAPQDTLEAPLPFFKLLKGAVINPAIIAIFTGLVVGALLHYGNFNSLSVVLLSPFNALLALFLFDMGLLIGAKREDLKSFSLPLGLFGLYMPLIGGLLGLLVSYTFHLDPGTGTLVAILGASASYIAVPAAMKIALPEAKEALYIPLSLAMAFPFNLIIGIPLYTYLARLLLG